MIEKNFNKNLTEYQKLIFSKLLTPEQQNNIALVSGTLDDDQQVGVICFKEMKSDGSVELTPLAVIVDYDILGRIKSNLS